MMAYPVSLLCGLLLVLGILHSTNIRKHWVLLISLSSAAGLLVTSCALWFALLISGRSTFTQVIWADVICLGVCGVVWYLRCCRGCCRASEKDQAIPSTLLADAEPPAHRHDMWFKLTAGVVSFIYAVFGSLVVFARPLGAWDAWGIWNLRARFLASPNWHTAFDATLVSSHLDYPLGHPLMVAHFWLYDQISIGMSELAPQLLGIHWLVIILALVWGVVNMLRGAQSAMLAVFLLVCLPWLATTTSNQYADLPLAAMMLVAITGIALALERQQVCWWVLAGMGMAGAMWTKNEGVAFAVSCMMVLSIYTLWVGWRTTTWHWRWFAGLALGFVPAGIALITFKLTYSQSNDIVRAHRLGSMLTLALDPSRHWDVIKTLYAYLGLWKVAPILLLPWLWILLSTRRSLAGCLLLACLVIHIAFLYGAYLVTPNELSWHVSTSAQRLVTQFWPALVVMFALWRSNTSAGSGSCKGSAAAAEQV